MAVQSVLEKISVTMRLDDGQVGGNQKYVNSNLATLSTSRYNDQKAMNIVELMKPCLSKSVLAVKKTEVSNLVNNE